MLAAAGGEIPLVPLSEILSLNGEDPEERLASVLAAAGTAWALGLAHHVICTGLKTFSRTLGDPMQLGSPDPAPCRSRS